MMFNFLKRIVNILLIPPLLLFVNEVKAQCDVFIEPGSIVVTDNGSGVKFQFDITNNSPNLWYGDDLKLYWTLNTSAPIWNIDYSQNTDEPPIAPGETRTIKTPWFDIPNLPSWFPNNPSPSQPWVESMEWPYYNLSFPFQGTWSPMNLRLGNCSLSNGTWVYDSNGNPYFGPFNSDCTNTNNDVFCDCDLEITNFNPSTLDIEVEVISHWNCGQPLNGLDNNNSANMDAVNMINFGIHVPGWDFPWGCATDFGQPGWSFTGWSAFDNPDLYLYSGDVFQGNLNDMIPPNSCFGEMLTNNTISECKEIVLWQINYSQTLSILDGGWAIFLNGNDTQEYPDFNVDGNTIIICGIPDINGCTDPVASNYNPNANADDGSCQYLYPNANPYVFPNGSTCLNGVPSNIYNISVANTGNDTLFYYCVEIPEINYNQCFNGYINPPLWIPPNEGQYLGQVIVPQGINQITINVYESEGEIENTFSNNIITVNVVFNGPNPCLILGCTDPNANNYNVDATTDDGSCLYDVLGCTDMSALNFNPNATIDDGSCLYDVLGCTDPNANNYNVDATIDDGSCLYDVLGCTDPNANNYNVDATIDDGSCLYDILGCTDMSALNFNPNATIDDGSCLYGIFGCTDTNANNYNINATIDDGSCLYDVLGCTDMFALNYNPNANIDDGTCIYPNYDPCDEFDGSTFVPNIFTPNNDGLNDVWRVLTDSDCWNEWELIIYNRWGQVVYTMDDPSQVWDGSFRGGDHYVSDGIYLFTLRGISWNLSTVDTSGFITILR